MSDVVWQALIAAVLAVVMFVLQERSKRAAARDAAAAAARDAAAAGKAEAVRKDLVAADQKSDTKLDALATVAGATHTLVNNNMGVQLKAVAELRRWKANQTGDPEHVLEALAAEKLWAEHQKKQAVVDAGGQQP
jgi:hypothetical protein